MLALTSALFHLPSAQLTSGRACPRFTG